MVEALCISFIEGSKVKLHSYIIRPLDFVTAVPPAGSVCGMWDVKARLGGGYFSVCSTR